MGRPVNSQRRFATQRYASARLQTLATALDAENDTVILLYLCGSALRRFLKEFNALPDEPLNDEPWLDFSSGYVQRALPTLPRQGATPPWRTYQNYVQDMLTIRFGKLEDGYMNFSRAPDPVPEEAMKAAAE